MNSRNELATEIWKFQILTKRCLVISRLLGKRQIQREVKFPKTQTSSRTKFSNPSENIFSLRLPFLRKTWKRKSSNMKIQDWPEIFGAQKWIQRAGQYNPLKLPLLGKIHSGKSGRSALTFKYLLNRSTIEISMRSTEPYWCSLVLACQETIHEWLCLGRMCQGSNLFLKF